MIKTIRCPVYDYDIVMVSTKRDLVKAVSRIFGLEHDEVQEIRQVVKATDIAGYTIGSDPCVMFAKKRDHGTIAHEAHHVANIILGDRGVPASRDNDEPQAYLEGWLVKHFIDPNGWERADKCLYLHQ